LAVAIESKRPTRAGVGVVVPRSFYAGDPLEVGPRLLNKLLVRGSRVGRIVEVEAYRGSEDPASHAFGGPSRRNATMFGPPGHLYVYFTYGMHFCGNAVCGPEGTGHAVLLRALAPLSGLAAMRRARRPGTKDSQLTSGPAKLCEAFGIASGQNGADLVTGDRGITIRDDGMAPPERPGISTRVGIRRAAELPWRWWVPGDPNVSKGPVGVGLTSEGGHGGTGTGTAGGTSAVRSSQARTPHQAR
jgi:DNA-3-methyladenine glycosylase